MPSNHLVISYHNGGFMPKASPTGPFFLIIVVAYASSFFFLPGKETFLKFLFPVQPRCPLACGGCAGILLPGG